MDSTTNADSITNNDIPYQESNNYIEARGKDGIIPYFKSQSITDIIIPRINTNKASVLMNLFLGKNNIPNLTSTQKSIYVHETRDIQMIFLNRYILEQLIAPISQIKTILHRPGFLKLNDQIKDIKEVLSVDQPRQLNQMLFPTYYSLKKKDIDKTKYDKKAKKIIFEEGILEDLYKSISNDDITEIMGTINPVDHPFDEIYNETKTNTYDNIKYIICNCLIQLEDIPVNQVLGPGPDNNINVLVAVLAAIYNR